MTDRVRGLRPIGSVWRFTVGTAVARVATAASIMAAGVSSVAATGVSSAPAATVSGLPAPATVPSVTAALTSADSQPITLEVDAREAPLRVFHARLVFSVKPGPLTLVYPKWIPGEHAPTGPITDLSGFKITAGGSALAWTRDPEDMYAFRCEVPHGAGEVSVTLDYLSPPDTKGFTSAASASSQLAIISFNQVLVYPKGATSDALRYSVRLRLPNGWKYGTALHVAREEPDSIDFDPVPLTTLIDSPVLAGAHFRTVPLTTGAEASVELDIAADSDAALAMSPELTAKYARLVAETNTLFAARHYRNYRFLLSLSDHIAHFGLEHHESSDDRTYERALVDEERRLLMAALLPHEFVHSWNGKYRRPAALTTPDYQQPMKTDLLWVYEGLTNYLGNVLAARSGLRSEEQYRQNLALDTARLDLAPGRTWRPLVDTAVAAQLLYEARDDWRSQRRGVDFYPEGDLIWLEADVIIRQRSHGRRSLEDFCRRFAGAPDGPPAVRTYAFDDVIEALNQIAGYDWRSFLSTRMNSTAPHAPMGGLEAAGWRLAYAPDLPEMLKAYESVRERIDESWSIGLSLEKDGNRIIDVVGGLPAAKAGIAPGMVLVAVNGRKVSKETLRSAIEATRSSSGPLDLLIENAETYATYRVDYHGGLRYPRLERDSARPDLLSEILKPLVPR